MKIRILPFYQMIFLIGLFILASQLSYSQYDASQSIPFILNAENSFVKLEKKIIKGKTRYVPQRNTSEIQQINPDPQKTITVDGIEIIPVTSGQLDKTEVWISYDPTNPLNIVASSNDSRYNSPSVNYKMGAYYSTDGGSTWVLSPTYPNQGVYITIPNGGNATVFDPGTVWDLRGNVYYVYGFDQILPGDQDGDNGVFICRSIDKGKNWEKPEIVAIAQDGLTMHDRYSVCCDVNQTSAYKNNMYVTWQRFSNHQSDGIQFAKTDGTVTWQETNQQLGDGSTQSPMPAVGPNGEVYVVWQRKSSSNMTTAVLRKSVDGGDSWDNALDVQTVVNNGQVNSSNGRSVLPQKQGIRVSSYAQLAVDCSNGPRKGWVYIVQSGTNFDGKPGIFLARSTNGGFSFTSNIKIDNNITTNDCFFPSISVDPITGMVAVLYYSSQDDATNTGVNAYVTISTDGINFSPLRITPTTWFLDNKQDVSQQDQSGNNMYWGDYTSIVVYDSKIYPCFWMPNGPHGSFSTNNVFTALLSPKPQAPKNLTAQNDWHNPSTVVLNWTDPTLNLLSQTLGNFKIQIMRDGVNIGEVNKGVQTYTYNGATDGKTTQYSIICVLDNNLTSNPATITLVPGGALEGRPPTELSPRPDANGISLTWTNPSLHIDNSFFQDLEKIYIYKDSVKVQEVDKSQLVAGQTTTVIVNLPTKAFYKLQLKAIGKRGTILTESKYSETVIAYSGAPMSTLVENFDNYSQITPHYTKGWDTTTIAAATPPNCFTDSPNGNYKKNENNELMFAPFIVPSDNTTFSFDHICLIDSSRAGTTSDYGIVTISDDYGKTWKGLRAYTMKASPLFTGNIKTSQWVGSHITLMDYVGKTVFVKFTLVSNLIAESDGWYIDNLRMDSDPNDVEEIVNIQDYFSASIYPNPSEGNISMILNSPVSGLINFTLFDQMANKICALESVNCETGSNSYNFDLKQFNLTNGIYYIKADCNKYSKIIPVVISK